MTSIPFGGIIRTTRKKYGWTQEYLASRAKVSRPTIARVETGANISTGTLAKIVAALSLTLHLEQTKQ
jgi:transcriptional regulator with XRE-family HTH domain